MTKHFAKAEVDGIRLRFHFHASHVNGLPLHGAVHFPAIQIYGSSGLRRYWRVFGWVSLEQWSEREAPFVFMSQSGYIVGRIEPDFVAWTRVALDHWLETGAALEWVEPPNSA